MQQLVSVWESLSVQRRALAVGASVGVVALVLGLGRLATTPDLTLLYSGLEPVAAGEIVAALDAQGVAYDVRGGAIFVEAAQRDALRMTLAGQGLPANASDGYELLDKMSGFGTTSQMFDAAYWRAKEGELARTILASPSIRAARVHIANSGTKPFQRDVTPTAAVTVTPAGGGLSTQQAKALRYLVASAVSGLAPENVSVIDANGGVVLSSEESPAANGSATDRAAELKRNVERLLEARVGYGKAVVEVNVETVTEAERITERRIDPDSRVAISQDVSQAKESSSDAAGDVTVASNLPDGDAEGGENTSRSQSSESRERINYEVSEIERQLTRNPGAVSRISTAVLIDGISETAEDGTTTWSPRPEAEMEALRELISAAIGFDAERGDTLSVRTMEFEPLPVEGSAPAAASLFGPINAMRLIQIGILAVVALILGLFVVRPILARDPAPALAGPDMPGGALTGEIDPEDTPEDLHDATGTAQGEPGAPGERTAVERLRQLIDERQDESLQILKSWMEDEGEKA